MRRSGGMSPDIQEAYRAEERSPNKGRHPPPPARRIAPPDDRLRRGIQYATASRLHLRRLWNTGPPGQAGDDSSRVAGAGSESSLRVKRSNPLSQQKRKKKLDCFVARAPRDDVLRHVESRRDFTISRRDAPEPCFDFHPQETRGRRESRVRAAPAVSRAMLLGKTHTSIQVQRRQSGLPCAMVYGLFRALPGDRAFLPPSSAGSFASRELDTSVGASGPHGFTVRSSHARQSQLSRPPHPTARS